MPTFRRETQDAEEVKNDRYLIGNDETMCEFFFGEKPAFSQGSERSLFVAFKKQGGFMENLHAALYCPIKKPSFLASCVFGVE